MLRNLQNAVNEWARRNFGPPKPITVVHVPAFLGMVEELGEISHAILKMHQGIRGTREEHEADIADGIADLFIFSLDFCAQNGLDAQEVLETTWAKVRERDWKKNSLTGVATDRIPTERIPTSGYVQVVEPRSPVSQADGFSLRCPTCGAPNLDPGHWHNQHCPNYTMETF